MTAQLIRLLIRYLPVNGPYPGMILPGHGSVERSFRELCLAECLNDPQFGYNFAMCFAGPGLTLPAGVLDMNVRRAFYYFSRNGIDDLMTEAYALIHPANIGKRKILNALLICRDVDMKQIAEAMSLPEEVVSVYAQLWFNVRDRMEDKYYIGSLVFPQTRFEPAAEDVGEGQDYAQALLRVGYEYGSDEVLYMAGLIPTRTSTSAASKSTEELEHLQVVEAITQARHGGANAKSAPAIDRANRLVAAYPMKHTTAKNVGPNKPDCETKDPGQCPCPGAWPIWLQRGRALSSAECQPICAADVEGSLASTGPRPFERGMGKPGALQPSCICMLQRGRALSSAECS